MRKFHTSSSQNNAALRRAPNMEVLPFPCQNQHMVQLLIQCLDGQVVCWYPASVDMMTHVQCTTMPSSCEVLCRPVSVCAIVAFPWRKWFSVHQRPHSEAVTQSKFTNRHIYHCTIGQGIALANLASWSWHFSFVAKPSWLLLDSLFQVLANLEGVD